MELGESLMSADTLPRGGLRSPGASPTVGVGGGPGRGGDLDSAFTALVPATLVLAAVVLVPEMEVPPPMPAPLLSPPFWLGCFWLFC